MYWRQIQRITRLAQGVDGRVLLCVTPRLAAGSIWPLGQCLYSSGLGRQLAGDVAIFPLILEVVLSHHS